MEAPYYPAVLGSFDPSFLSLPRYAYLPPPPPPPPPLPQPQPPTPFLAPISAQAIQEVPSWN